MRIYYDTEFIEDGRTVDLISIGMVAEDGRELYAVNSEMPHRRIRKHSWLMANVVPSLPQPHGPWIFDMPKRWLFDYTAPCVKPRAQIAEQVRSFVAVTSAPELWASYGAYDHVVLAQLFGPMADLPDLIPMWTNDLQQEWQRLGQPRLPQQHHGEHNALEDARHNEVIGEFLTAIDRGSHG